MATINRITIDSIATTIEKDGSYSIDSNWDVAKSGGTYTDSYFMQIMVDGGVIAEQEIPNTGGETIPEGTINLKTIDGTKMYSLRITDCTKTIFSSSDLILFQTYEGVNATYDGKSIEITWSKPNDFVKCGRCTLSSIEDSEITYAITPNTRHLDFNISLLDYDANNIWSLVLVPNMNEIVDGPPSALLDLYTQNPMIQSVTSLPNPTQANEVDIMICFQQPYGNPADLMVKAVLWENEVAVISTVPILMPQPQNNTYTLSMTVPKDIVDPNLMGQYGLGIYLCTSNTVNQMNTKDNYCQLTDTKIFQRAYYPIYANDQVTGLAYRETSEQETMSQVLFYEELFQQPLQQPITSGVLSLTPQTTGVYLLKIATQNPILQADYLGFLTALTQGGILNSGFYKVQDAIVRAGNIAFADLLYFHCGLDKNKRCADLRPGMTLEVETATYMPLYQIQREDAASGFVSTHTAQYNISTRPVGNDIRLEFNSFIDQFAENITVASDTDEVQAGGVLDLFVNGYRQPFYKIIYPSNIPTSNDEQTHYQSDNVLLVGAGTFGQMQDIQTNMTKMETYGNDDNASVLLFRGRAAVTLKITVWVNGSQCLLPVGTTLGTLLERQGVFSSGTADVSLKRLSAMGYTNVQLETSGSSAQTEVYWRTLPLIHGDKVEVN